MSTIGDFDNAPTGATATHKATGNRVMKVDGVELRWITRWGRLLTDKEVVRWGFTLDPPAPTTVREALELAWELAHEVKPGQVIPEGTRYLLVTGSGLKEYTTQFDFKIGFHGEPERRTLEPLPDPEPDWLEAPAVVAWSRWDDVRRKKVWSKVDKCYKSTDGEIVYWSNLLDVTPLYPNEKETKE